MSSDEAPSEGNERETAADEAWRALYELVFERVGQQRFHDACDATGLAPGGLKTLLQLSPDQAIPMRDLADFFRCDPSYVTSLVDGLEAAGLAERRSHPTDRRVKMVVLSGHGVEALAQVRKILGEPPASFAVLSTADLLRLRALLAKLTQSEPPLGR
jgi:DNA-binding MarR family transcriptional regulator